MKIPISIEDGTRIRLSFYLGKHCKYCEKKYKTIDDLEDVIFIEYNALACKKCWNINNDNK